MGDIKIPMMVVLKGKLGRLSPNAARVPKKVEIIVENMAIIKLFFMAPCQFRLFKNSIYQRSE